MKLKNFLLLVLLAALWGPSFLFIKVAVAEIPPLTLVLGRVGIAAVLLTVFLLVQGGSAGICAKTGCGGLAALFGH